MQVEIVHHVPGRLRLRVPDPDILNTLEDATHAAKFIAIGMQSLRVNSWCASVIIHYDLQVAHAVEKILAALANLAFPEGPEPAKPTVGKTGLLRALWHKLKSAVQFLRRPHTLLWSSIALVTTLLVPGITPVMLPVLVACALPSLTRAWNVLYKERRLNVDFLDSLAIFVSVGRGQFFTAAFMIWMICLGDWIRDKTAARSRKALSEMLRFQATTAWLVRDDQIVRVPSDAVIPGETVVVYPGEIIPVDGVITSGYAAIDQKTVTGESLPIEKTVGNEVFASTVLHNGKLRVCASRVGSQTTAAQIVQLIESAPLGETRMQNYAEKLGDRLVAPMLLLSTGLYAATRNLDRLLSMVIIDYGTGIRVAAPTSVLAGMTHAARHGILIKGGRHMEKLAVLDTVVFDKTGTLTHGTPEIRDIISCDKRHFPAREILTLAAAAEARLKHPVSQALVAKAEAERISVPERLDSHFEIGLGVEAHVNGYYVHVGSERFLAKHNIRLDGSTPSIEESSRRGWSTLLFAVDGVLKGVITYADKIRAESCKVVQTLRNAGVKNVVMITGDNDRVARTVAKRLGIDDYFAEILPSHKAELVKALQKRGHVVGMVGDGINDSPALAHADVGIAMKHGADVARETANVVLMEDNLWNLIAALEISRSTIRNIQQNYAIIAGLNTLALALAIPSGLVSPNISALISNGSAILASLNAVRPVLGD